MKKNAHLKKAEEISLLGNQGSPVDHIRQPSRFHIFRMHRGNHSVFSVGLGHGLAGMSQGGLCLTNRDSAFGVPFGHCITEGMKAKFLRFFEAKTPDNPAEGFSSSV